MRDYTDDKMNSIVTKQGKIIIGMIHLPPLISYPDSPGMEGLLESSMEDLHTLEKGGVDAAIIENQNDDPNRIFLTKKDYRAFESLAKKVVKNTKIPIGISALRNDWKSAFDIAKASGAKFVRLDAFVDKVLMGGNVVRVNPQEVIAYRRKISAEGVLLLADVQVKHAKMLEKKSLAKSVQQAISNGADAVVVTGPYTGIAPVKGRVMRVKSAAGNIPVIVGSGINSRNIKEMLRYADGAIVGTSLKVNGKISKSRVTRLMKNAKDRYILLDVHGVLTDGNERSRFFSLMSKRYGIGYNKHNDLWMAHLKNLDIGVENAKNHVDSVNKAFNMSLSVDEYYETMTSQIKVNQFLLETLKRFENHEICIVSDTFPEISSRLDSIFGEQFKKYKKFYSFEFGKIKKDGLLKGVLKAIDAKPSECILIDDNKENVDAANRLGMYGILFTSNSQLKNDITRLKSDKGKVQEL